jgi:hypothetical protein
VDRDAGGGGVWTRARIELVALEDLRSDNAVATTAILQPGTYREQPELTGIANQVYAIETMIHYVRRRDMVLDMEEFVEQRLAQLADYLLHNALPLGQCIDVLEIDALEGNLLNSLLLEKNKAYYGGTLTALFEVGDSLA